MAIIIWSLWAHRDMTIILWPLLAHLCLPKAMWQWIRCDLMPWYIEWHEEVTQKSLWHCVISYTFKAAMTKQLSVLGSHQQEVIVVCQIMSSITGILQSDPNKVKAVSEWPIPSSCKGFAFLGFANFYWRFVRNYSAIAASLTKLMSFKRPFSWTNHAESALSSLKSRFTTVPFSSSLI